MSVGIDFRIKRVIMTTRLVASDVSVRYDHGGEKRLGILDGGCAHTVLRRTFSTPMVLLFAINSPSHTMTVLPGSLHPAVLTTSSTGEDSSRVDL
jgi:hypothetical protein